MMVRVLLSLLALIVLAAGLLAGAAGPVRAGALHHHAGMHHAAQSAGPGVLAEDPCARAAVSDAPSSDALPSEAALSGRDCGDGHRDGPVHRHGAADCLCMPGSCTLAALPSRFVTVAYGAADVLLPRGDRSLPTLAHAPPLKPPRA
ncbi:hypothetical protein [Azospirillum thermophilum]|uniref:Uncharacterized protein n=1 Tax=Azospirillum thermophilum TaxID=2202148 RepID=A0A2S2CUY7_9PROT|nr:hypothetical protein [Azospirillum thermophilum]AWK88311.1 hypothetical protein DEW08_19665 [Azospirillum thermophilum]